MVAHMKYSLVRTVKPSEPVVTLVESRAQLRVDTFGSPATSPEDQKISDLVSAITESLDAGTGWLGRALAPQTWRLGLKEFPSGCSWEDTGIILPFPPFIEVVSFTYVDTDGDTQTLVLNTDYRILPWGDDGAVLRAAY